MCTWDGKGELYKSGNKESLETLLGFFIKTIFYKKNYLFPDLSKIINVKE